MDLIIERPWPVGTGGVQKVYRAPNGYGASVIQTVRSYGYDYGLWELAVIEFKGDTERYKVTHDTPITDDVLGYLEMEEVRRILQQIADLPPREEDHA